MSHKVVFLKSAEQDLRDLRAYLVKNFGAETWLESYEKIKSVIGTLKSFPYSGVIPEPLEQIGLTQYHQVLAGKNRIIYEVRQHTVYIHIIADTRRDMKSLLTLRLLRPVT